MIAWGIVVWGIVAWGIIKELGVVKLKVWTGTHETVGSDFE